MSPDPSGLTYADPTSPQTLNLYSYVMNQPLTYIDPDGLSACNQGATPTASNRVLDSVVQLFCWVGRLGTSSGDSSAGDTMSAGGGGGAGAGSSGSAGDSSHYLVTSRIVGPSNPGVRSCVGANVAHEQP